MQKITPFFMFEGKAEEAMHFYMSLFGNSSVINISYYGAGEPGREGTVKHALFTLNGQHFMCIDSSIKHAFSFTPSVSMFVDCDTEEEIQKLFHHLSENGQVYMALDAYPFSRMFGWVADIYGVSWQLNLASRS